ncbi:coiled-coil domain-containing protein 57 [Cygnus olor]|uniref:coiled-coil domain-containing protein 57 n=1 Tax=Cygnus olor TaxID=8869 RepID=UPI001ADE4351|nr:coiled-coil domain-containing protein 57 [Cygnus olor]
MSSRKEKCMQWHLIISKRELHDCQFPCQKKMLQDVIKQLQDTHENFNKLKDFVYNLRTLEERDEGLELYDVTFTHLKTSENAKQAEISDLRLQLDKLKEMFVNERRKRDKYYQQNLEEHQLELEQFCSSNDSHIGHQCEEYINLKCHMERKTQEVEGELACQKQAEADLQRTGYRLHEVETLLSAMTVEREQTIQASSLNYGILPEGEKQILQYDDKSYLRKDIPILEIQKLKEQNASLRAAVAQMRKEMESLDEQMQSSLPLTEQTITGLTAEISSLTPGNLMERAEGSFCTDQVSVRTTLNNINVSSNNLGCIINPNTEKGSKTKALEQKTVDFGPISDNCCPGVSLQYGFSCPLQGMQNKLNEAARKISVLSQEKQQLIEMGNRPRADIGMVLKEGLWHPISSKHCTVCVASGSLSPRELLKRTQCQLSALKHLQHRLATQELQYAKQQHLSRISSIIACPKLKGEKAPSSCGEETELPSAQVKLDFSTGNCGPEQQKAHASSKMVQSQPLKESPSQAQQTWISSSRAHRSCQGIWQTLEMRSRPSILSSQNNTKQALEFEVTCSNEQSEESQQNIKGKDKLEMPAADLTVRGTKLEVQQKLKSRILSCTYPIKQKSSSNMSKIRNYNIKD